MEKIEPVESIGFPGYYEIPGFSFRYAIDREGRVINKLTRKVLSGSVNSKGYCHYRLIANDLLVLTIGRHRLLAFVFKHPGVSLKGLVVNHLNGIPGDDRLNNLEWTTHKGNIEHAGMLGLTTKCIPVSVRDIDTGVVIKFPSIVECARHFGVTKDTINWRVKVGEAKLFPDRKQYRTTRADDPWISPGNMVDEKVEFGRSRCILLRYLDSETVVVFPQLQQLASHLGVSPATITLWLNQPNQPVLPGCIQIKLASDQTPWRTIADPRLELENYTGKKSVVVTKTATGESKIFDSAVECARSMGILPTTLNLRLKSKGTKTFSDGFSYCYY